MENAQEKILLSWLRNPSLFCARKQEAAQRHEQQPRLPSLLFQPRIWHKPVGRHRGPRTFVSSRAAGAVRTPTAASLAPYTSRWVVVKNYIEKLTWAKGPSSPLPPQKKKSVPFRCFGAWTYCEMMLNWMARDTSVSHFSTWYRSSRDFNTKSRIHFRSTTLMSSKGCSKVRLEPPLSYLMFP